MDVESVQWMTNCCCCASELPPSSTCWSAEPGRAGGEGERDRRVNARRTGLRSRDLRERDRDRDRERACELGAGVDCAAGCARNDEAGVDPDLSEVEALGVDSPKEKDGILFETCEVAGVNVRKE